MKEILWRLKGSKAYSKGFIIKRKYGLLAFSDSEYGDSSIYYHPDEIDMITGDIRNHPERINDPKKETT